MRAPLPRIHAITDERIARRPDVAEVAGRLAAAGGSALALHARGRGLSGMEHHELAVRLSAWPPARLFVNDRLDIALATRADGVQLGAAGLPVTAARALDARWWIGKSVHSLAEADAAIAEGADYLLVGPVFATATHPATAPLGPVVLGQIAALGAPVVAIGGVTPANVSEVRGAGAYGAAAIRALWDAADPAAAAAAVSQLVEGWA